MYIIFDIGATKTRIAGVETTDAFSESTVIETPSQYTEGLKVLKDNIIKISNGKKIRAIAGGIAGPVDQKTNIPISSPNLPDWAGKDIAQELAKEFDTKVFIDNDSAIVGLGEAVFGAGKDFPIVAYITVSTGVGGVRIVNGAIDERSVGFEPGHQIMDEAGHDLESLISGHAIEEKTGHKPESINDPEFWEKLEKILARGLNNIIVNWSPDVVVLGGSMINKIGISVENTEAQLKELLKIFPKTPPLKKAELGDLGGLYGGLAYLKLIEK